MIQLIFIALFPALCVYFLDYCFGKPGDEIWNDKAILSKYPYLLAVRRLKLVGLWPKLAKQLAEQLRENKADRAHTARLRAEFKRIVFTTAKPFFFYEYAAGLCPVCFHFWAHNIFAAFYFLVNKNIFLVNKFGAFENVCIFVVPFLTGHLLLRFLKRYV
jgi:hypothetical protein